MVLGKRGSCILSYREVNILRVWVFAALMLACSGISWAQQADSSRLNIGMRGRYSHIIDGHKIYAILLDSYNFGSIDATVGWSASPSHGDWYDRFFNYPAFGVGFSYERLGVLAFKGISSLGDMTNLYGWAEFSLIRMRRFRIALSLELGVSFSSVTYDYYSNPNNQYIGSKVFADMGTGLQTEWLFSPRWSVLAGCFLTHHSNGMIRSPNVGINEFSLSMGVRHYLAPQSFTVVSPIMLDEPDDGKGLHLNVYAAAGVHSCPIELDGILTTDSLARLAPARFQGVMAVEPLWRYTPVWGTGVGMELGYVANNYCQTDLLLTGKEDPQGYSPLRIGAYLKQELWYRQLSVHVAVGAYLFKRSGLTEDVGDTFEKIGIRYHFRRWEGLFYGMEMRAHHFDRSYTLECSLGYTF